MGTKLGIEKVQILKSGRHIEELPPPKKKGHAYLYKYILHQCTLFMCNFEKKT